MNEIISKEKIRSAMYHEAFETDTELQKWESGCWIRYKLFEDTLDKLPTLQDVVQVVRCKDCTEWQTSWTPSRGTENTHYCAVMDGATKPTDYCSYGEKRKQTND